MEALNFHESFIIAYGSKMSSGRRSISLGCNICLIVGVFSGIGGSTPSGVHLEICEFFVRKFHRYFLLFFPTAEVLDIVTNSVKIVGFQKTFGLPELVSVCYINCFFGHYHFEYNSLLPNWGYS